MPKTKALLVLVLVFNFESLFINEANGYVTEDQICKLSCLVGLTSCEITSWIPIIWSKKYNRGILACVDGYNNCVKSCTHNPSDFERILRYLRSFIPFI